ncbi:MAG TPA: hypothetical protein VGV59_20960 [Pyrinomonadaceae bacterium]|nr:hypothetical protein [Pyrinomonadaceae bacterium]
METLSSILLVVAILVVSALITNWFARTMYNRCASCGTLNARRRTHCRACQTPLK